MNVILTLIIITYTAICGFLVTLHIDDSEDVIITAIQDNGCASHQELKPVVKRIDNYQLNNLHGE